MIEAAESFKALSEPVRIRILALLTEGELCVCDVMAVLDLPQSTASRHLGRLRQAGLVQDRRNGKWVYYRFREDNSPITAGIRNTLRSMRDDHQFREDRHRLSEYAKTKQC